MKRSSPLWGSVSVLIGVVIAILALVRGAWLVPLLLLTFTAWGLWVVMFQLQPAWDSIRGYRKKEHDARRQREASLYSTAQANADAMQLLLRHVNHRISAYLKSVSERPLGMDNREPNCARYAGRHRAYPRVWY